MTTTQSVFNSETSNNNIEFEGLDKEKGDNWVNYVVGGVIGAGVDLYSQYKRNGDSLTWEQFDGTEFLLNVGAGVYSSGASTVGGAVLRGSVASGTTETYNQVVNEKDNSLVEKVEEVGKASFLGGASARGVTYIGKVAEKNLPKTGVIGSYKDTTKKGDTYNKTHKVTAESIGSISGATLPEIIKNENAQGATE